MLPPKKSLAIVFFSALILRLLLLLVSSYHPQGWLYPDSHMYMQIAEGILENGEYVHKDGEQYYPETERLPLYPLYLALFLISSS